MSGESGGSDPAEQVVRHALARGYVTQAQVQAALQQSTAGSGGLLPLLRPYLSPAQLAELTAVYRQAQAGGPAQTFAGSPGPAQTFAGPPGPAQTFAGPGGPGTSGAPPGGAMTFAAPPESGGTLGGAPSVAPAGHDAQATIGMPLLEGPTGTYADTMAEGGAGETGATAGVPGSIVGPYVIEGELGRGGMGVVSIARHREVDRKVALKQLLPAGVRNPILRERFLREAQALARLDHHGVVRVYESGETPDGGLYMAMDLVEGEALDTKLKREGAMPPRAAAALLEQVARAVAHAHERGILHRDLKPANILIGLDGKPRVTDFGLALDPAEEQERLTQSGQMLGTPSYMPPEQASGEKNAMDERSDVYALGATLFDLVTGQPPFTGQSAMNVVTQVLQDQAPRLSKVMGEVDRDLETIVAKCLEKERFHRYRSAKALADDLGRYARDEPIAARPLTAGQKLARWRRRHPAAVVGLVAAGAVCLVAAGIGVRELRRSRADPPRLTVQPPAALTTDGELALRGRVTAGTPPFTVRVEVANEGGPPDTATSELAKAGDYRVRLELRPGVNRIRVEVTDSWGAAAADGPHEVLLDREPPQLTLAPPSAWLAPSVVLTGTLSEAGCTLTFRREDRTVDGFEAEVSGRSVTATLPFAGVAKGAELWVTDPAGNRARAALPFRLVGDEGLLATALKEAPPGEPIFLLPGRYRIVDGAVQGVPVAGRPRDLRGVEPLPQRLLDVGIGRLGFAGKDEHPSAVAAHLDVEGATGLELALPSGQFSLRGLSLERPLGVETRKPVPAIVLVQGKLALDGVLLRTGSSGGVRLGVGDAPGEAVARITSSTLVSPSEPAVRVGARGRATVSDSQLLGDLEAAAARGIEWSEGKWGSDLHDNLVVVNGGEFDMERTLLGGHGGGGMFVAGGAVVLLRDSRVTKITSTAIRVKEATATFLNVDVNQAERGIYASNGSRVRVEGCVLSGHQLRGMWLHQVDPESSVRDTAFRDNAEMGLEIKGKPTFGDAVWPDIERCAFEGNRIGIELDGAGPVTFKDCTIRNNRDVGLRAHVNDGRPVQARLERCTFEQNGPLDLLLGTPGVEVELIETDVPDDRRRVVPGLTEPADEPDEGT